MPPARPTWHREGPRAFVLLAPPAPGSLNRRVLGWTAYRRGRKVWTYAALHTDTRRTTGDVTPGRDGAARGRKLVEQLLETT